MLKSRRPYPSHLSDAEWALLAPLLPPPKPKRPTREFRVLPRRWVVERTFVWLGQSRRLSKDYERLPATSEAMIYGAMSRLMLGRLTRAAV